jgi:hypothetical protein
MSDEQNSPGASLSVNDLNILAGQAENQINLAVHWLQKNNYLAAEILVGPAKKLLTLSGKTEHAAWINYYHVRTVIAQERKQFQTALVYCRKSLAMTVKHFPPGHCAILTAQANVGECLGELGYKDTARAIVAENLEKLKAADVGTDANMIAWKESTVKSVTDVLNKLS